MLSVDEYNSGIRKLKEWSDAYYNSAKLLATDDEYDSLLKEITEFEKQNPTLINPASPSKVIGAPLQKQTKFKKDKHIEKMYSLDNVFTKEEFVSWFDKLPKDNNALVAMPKYDGLSLNLYYVDGVLTKAITRGDGSIGENVTINARHVQGIPARLPNPETIEIRGEVIMPISVFTILNDNRAKEGLDLFASPRNAAAGSLRVLDPSITRDRQLQFKVWGIGHNTFDTLPNKLYTLVAWYNTLSSLGFNPDYSLITTVGKALEYYEDTLRERDDLDYPIDGIVFKLNSIDECEKLGFTAKFPRWAIAFKLPALEKTSKLLSIDNQVGKTGVVTPVANITGVDIDGVFVRKVILHNYNEIKLKDLRINDTIIVIRSGDVIPKITAILKERRDGSEEVIVEPTNCPVCNSSLKAIGPQLFCTDSMCPSVLRNKLVHFVSRDGLNIDGMSEATVKAIMDREEKLHPDYSLDFGYYILKIFSITLEELLELDGFSLKKANNLYEAIQKAKTVELYKLIDSLSIPNIGTTASKAIVAKYNTLDSLLLATVDGLVDIAGIGMIQAISFVTFIEEHEDLLWKLMMFGFNIVNTVEDTSNTILISATGKFPVDRKTVISMASKHLGCEDCVYTDNISSKTALLVVGDDPSNKLKKAEKLKVKIIKFEEMINAE